MKLAKILSIFVVIILLAGVVFPASAAPPDKVSTVVSQLNPWVNILSNSNPGTIGYTNGAPIRVQSVTGATILPNNQVLVAMGLPANGNTLIAVISTRGTSANRVSSISQTGAAWSRVAQGTNTNGTTTEIWYAPNVSNAGLLATINMAASLHAAAVIAEYRGLLTPTSFDVSNNNTGIGTAASTGTTAATAQANELWIGGIGLVNSNYTLGAVTNSFNAFANANSAAILPANSAKIYALERIVSATGTAFSGGTISTSSQWSGAIATFRAAGATPNAFTVSAGNNRLTLAGVCIETAANAAISSIDVRLDTSTGAQFTQIKRTTNNLRENCYMGYLREADVSTGTHRIYLNVTMSASTITGLHIDVGTYQGVDQTSPITASAANNSAATSVQFGSAVAYNSGSTTVYMVAGGNDLVFSNTTALTNVGTFTEVAGARTWANTLLNDQSTSIAESTNGSSGTYPATSQISWTGTAGRSAIVAASLNPILPVITSNGGGDTAAISVPENTTAVTTVVATDPNNTGLTYTIAGGADQLLFSIDGTSGVLTFNTAPDFETPGDTGLNNVYEVTVSASDGSASDTQAISVTVTDADEIPPTLTIGAPSVTITNSGPVNFPITISGATNISLVAGNVTLNASGVTGTVSVTNGTTATPTVTVSGLSGNGTFTISIAAGVASDDASNTTAAAGPSAQVAVDNASVYILTNGTVGWPGNIVILNNGAYTNHFTSLEITFNKDVSDPAGNNLPDDVTNPANYLLVQYGPDKVYDTVSCSGGVLNDDVQIPTGPVSYNGTSFTATVTLNNGAALPAGYYRLYVCGTTSITDAAGNALNDGADSVYNFRIFDVSLPKTGFAPGVVTQLPVQPAEKAYSITDVKLEIPSLGLSLAVVGVPQVGKGWDVSWLGNDAGWLDGSAFPSWEGNSVITGHVWDANNKPGPFQNIKSLKYGDQVKLYAYGKVYTYAVRESKLITTGNTSAVFKHEDKAWITLITCEDFNASKTSYDYRRIVRAVLLSVK